MNLTFQISHRSSRVLHQEERWFALVSPRLSRAERCDCITNGHLLFVMGALIL